MKAVLGFFGVAILFLAAGVSSWTTGLVERRAANAHRQLLMLKYSAPAGDFEDVERSLRFVRRLPWVANLNADVRRQQATAQYWLADEAPAGAATEAGRSGTESDASLLLIAANTAFRGTTLDGSNPEAIPALERILEQYAAVLQRDPEQFDAAYNYEFVARTRDALGGPPAERGARGLPSLPSPRPTPGRTIHGNRGATPAEPDMKEFKVIVPERSEERLERPEAGKGGPTVRKG